MEQEQDVVFAKILVVDDEPDLEVLVRQKFRRKIRRGEYEFIFAQNGVEALKALESEPDTDLVLTDINMPEMDGLTLLSELLSLDLVLRSVVVSAYGDMQNIRTAMNRGAIDFITKPIDFQDLEVTITKTLEDVLQLKTALERERQAREALEQLNNQLEERITERTRELEEANAKLAESEREARNELEEAYQMQVGLLPETAPEFPGIQVFGQSIPAKDVGGDFFDYLSCQDKTKSLIAVADISGKGMYAAMNAVMASGILQLTSKQHDNAPTIMAEVNDALCQSLKSDMNATVILAEIDPVGRTMTIVNAGQHAYPLLCRNGKVEPIIVRGMAVGMIPGISYEPVTLDLQVGDLIFLMTDGITEPRNAEGIMYQESKRLAEVISNLEEDTSVENVVDTIISDVFKFSQDQDIRDDDITLIVVKIF